MFLAKPRAEEFETMVFRHRDVLGLVKESGEPEEVDAVCDQVVFTSPSNPGRQVKAYPRRELVLANSMSEAVSAIMRFRHRTLQRGSNPPTGGSSFRLRVEKTDR